jgi:hypothetical protein
MQCGHSLLECLIKDPPRLKSCAALST